MCLAIPGIIVKKNDKTALVNFGENTTRNVDISLVKVKEGDYVIVHAGFAIEVLNKSEAKKTIKALNEVFNA